GTMYDPQSANRQARKGKEQQVLEIRT
ncbi:MAG: hypothetical protein ACJA11_001694, partial [Glaciecola sp.]